MDGLSTGRVYFTPIALSLLWRDVGGALRLSAAAAAEDNLRTLRHANFVRRARGSAHFVIRN